VLQGSFLLPCLGRKSKQGAKKWISGVPIKESIRNLKILNSKQTRNNKNSKFKGD
jgi:hypothetical protein